MIHLKVRQKRDPEVFYLNVEKVGNAFFKKESLRIIGVKDQ